MTIDATDNWVTKVLIEEALRIIVRPAGQRILKIIKRKWKPETHWESRINKKYEGYFKVFNSISEEPNIEIDGKYPLTKSQKSAATAIRRKLRTDGRPNDQHAILTDLPNWGDSPLTLHVKTLDFADLKALRNEGHRPMVLSSCVVLLCRKSKELIVQRRSVHVDTYKNALHTFGGAFIPPSGVDPDRKKLSKTVKREVNEEIQISIDWKNPPPMIMSQEVKTGFIQLVVLGVNIDEESLIKYNNNWEGDLVKIKYSQLEGILHDQSWVHSGIGHILSWLAYGAPNAGLMAKFGDLSARELFNKIV